VVKDIYTNCRTKVRIGQGQTGDIPCERGVKQRCLLSPILFNLALEQLVRAVDSKSGYNFDLGEVTILVYADDLCLVAESSLQLQALLNMAHKYAGWADRCKPAKCVTLSLNSLAPKAFCGDDPIYSGGGTASHFTLGGPLPDSLAVNLVPTPELP